MGVRRGRRRVAGWLPEALGGGEVKPDRWSLRGAGGGAQLGPSGSQALGSRVWKP